MRRSPPADLAQMLVAAMLVPAPFAVLHAQPDAEALEALDACSRIADRETRLDCIDAVLAERNRPAPPAAPEAAAPIEERSAPSAPAPAAAAPAAAAAAPAAAAAEEERLSRREQRRREQAAAIRALRIVEVNVNSFGWSTFVTDGGEAWQSVNTPEYGYPDVPFTAQLEPGSGGSYFLRLPNRNRRLRVALIE